MNFPPELIKALTDAGMGVATLIALICVIFYQRLDMRTFITTFSKQLHEDSQKHTEAMKELNQTVQQHSYYVQRTNDLVESFLTKKIS